jgi:hypothetical protein
VKNVKTPFSCKNHFTQAAIALSPMNLGIQKLDMTAINPLFKDLDYNLPRVR